MKKLLLVFLIIFSLHAEEDEILPKTICSPQEQYTLIKVLGQGFFGKVYLAEDSKGQQFAIKSLKGPNENMGKYIPRLADAEREYRQGKLIDHPNVVKALDFFENEAEEKVSYMVMELVDGKTLQEVPSKSVLYSNALSASIHLIEALRYALSQKLFYIDLHSHNIMLNNASDIMIVDLASFYTFDELVGFVEEESNEKPLSKKEIELKLFFSHNSHLMQKLSESEQTLEMSILCGYLSNITEICIQIIKKSNLERDQKLEMYAAIKKTSWAFFEDLEDNLPTSIETYFDSLIQILSSP